MTERQAAAERVAIIINEAERAMDLAMSQASALLTELPGLQRQAGLNAAWAQPTVQSVCAALGDMTTARGSLIEAHKTLSVVQRRLGVTIAEGPLNDKSREPGGISLNINQGVEEERIIRLRA